MQDGRALTSKTAQSDGYVLSAAREDQPRHSALRSILHTLARLLMLVAVFTTSLPSHAQVVIPTPMEDYSRALECLTLAVAYEAGYENLEGKQAVAEVVLNRLRSSSFQNTVCDVVFAGSTRRTGCQFSFTCDGSLKRRLPERVMLSARTVAEDALANRTPPRAPGATHYHASYVNPYWAPSLTRVATIGAHIFYHPPGKPAPYGPIGLQGAAAPATSSSRASTDQQSSSVAPAVFAPWGLAPAALGTDRP